MKSITTAGNTVVPAILALEDLGFSVSIAKVGDRDVFRATRGDETYGADDPVAVLGLLKLVELRDWSWQASDADLERVRQQYNLW
jgi:hypothetical protein